jgi:hypothetical protein
LGVVFDGHGAGSNQINEEDLFGGVAFAEDMVPATTLETIDPTGKADGVSLAHVKAEGE